VPACAPPAFVWGVCCCGVFVSACKHYYFLQAYEVMVQNFVCSSNTATMDSNYQVATLNLLPGNG
jgi:hypothetical protein